MTSTGMGDKEGTDLLSAWGCGYPRGSSQQIGKGSQCKVPAGEGAVATVRIDMVTLAPRADGIARGEHSAISVSPYLPSHGAGKAEWSAWHTVGAKQTIILL